MRPAARRRKPTSGVNGHGPRGSNSGSKHPWLVFCLFGGFVVMWVTVTILLVPNELAEINASLFHRASAGDKGASAGADHVSDWKRPGTQEALPMRRPAGRTRPNKYRPRMEITLDEIVFNMRSFLEELDEVYKAMKDPEPYKIWDHYKAAADRWLLPMDRDSEGQTLFKVRSDRSVFVSVASYRDENCPTTLTEMFSKADRPDFLFIGLVQQNCVFGCKTGVLERGIVEDTVPDINCYEAFCATELGSRHCEAGNVRNFFVDEAEALGPAVARYFASKLWRGENYFMQIDAHSLFEEGWDTLLIQDVLNTPSYPQSVLSHYPPDTKTKYQNQAGYRICGAEFAKTQVEHDIVRLSAGIPYDSHVQDKPCPAPFVGAGFFFAHASVLGDVPFDPYVPWVFMGEEILLSLRFWTWGYDIYSPTRNVLSHFYVRRHTPKFWETVNRLFHKPSMHNDLTSVIIHRVKNIAGYPESSADVLMNPSLLVELDLYGDGPVRAMEDYMDLVGLDMTSKRARPVTWCTKCQTPYPV